MFFIQAVILSFISLSPSVIDARAYPGQAEDALDPNQKPYAHLPGTYAMDKSDQDIIISEHNIKRSLHVDTGNLTWNNTLAEYAEAFVAAYDCASGELHHSGGEYGENIAIGHSVLGSVDGWYNEIKDYNYSNPDFTEAAGHFTQVVWKDTKQVGCAIRYCNSYWGNITVCEYDPSGNYLGEFADNVMPVKDANKVKRDVVEASFSSSNSTTTTTLAPITQSSSVASATSRVHSETSTATTENAHSTIILSSYEGAASNLAVTKFGVAVMFVMALL